MNRSKGKERWIHGYKSSQKILLVGEGDFSFSACLARAFHTAENMVATSYLKRNCTLLQNRYSINIGLAYHTLKSWESLGCLLLYKVDVYKMHTHPNLKNIKFDIIFNFPHAGHYDYLCERDPELIDKMLTKGGEVHLRHREDPPYDSWNVVMLAAKAGLFIKEKVDFNKSDYPGYHNKRGGGINTNKSFPIICASTFKFAPYVPEVVDRHYFDLSNKDEVYLLEMNNQVHDDQIQRLSGKDMVYDHVNVPNVQHYLPINKVDDKFQKDEADDLVDQKDEGEDGLFAEVRLLKDGRDDIDIPNSDIVVNDLELHVPEMVDVCQQSAASDKVGDDLMMKDDEVHIDLGLLKVIDDDDDDHHLLEKDKVNADLDLLRVIDDNQMNIEIQKPYVVENKQDLDQQHNETDKVPEDDGQHLLKKDDEVNALLMKDQDRNQQHSYNDHDLDVYVKEMNKSKGKERWIHGYKSSQKILLVGEGDFSFSACLARAFHTAENVVATSYLNRKSLLNEHRMSIPHLEELESLGCLLLYEVDVYKMHTHPILKNMKFDIIIFNFPPAGYHDHLCELPALIEFNLVEAYLENASSMLTEWGEVHLRHRGDPPCGHLVVEFLAVKAGLFIKEKVDFNKSDFPSYHNKSGWDIDTNKSSPIICDSILMFAPYVPNGQHHLKTDNADEKFQKDEVDDLLDQKDEANADLFAKVHLLKNGGDDIDIPNSDIVVNDLDLPIPEMVDVCQQSAKSDKVGDDLLIKDDEVHIDLGLLKVIDDGDLSDKDKVKADLDLPRVVDYYQMNTEIQKRYVAVKKEDLYQQHNKTDKVDEDDDQHLPKKDDEVNTILMKDQDQDQQQFNNDHELDVYVKEMKEEMEKLHGDLYARVLEMMDHLEDMKLLVSTAYA